MASGDHRFVIRAVKVQVLHTETVGLTRMNKIGVGRGRGLPG